MIEAEFVNLVSNVGFPIAVALWFMYRTEKVIKSNTVAINELKTEISKIRGVI